MALPDLLRLCAGGAAAAIALVFARAGLHKAGDRTAFQGVLADYGLVPEAALRPAAALLPLLEIIAAAGLAFNATRPAGAGLAAGLLGLYAVAMALVLLQGRREIDCGCGGAPTPVGWALVLRNLALALALVPAGLGLGAWRALDEVLVGWAVASVGLTTWVAVEAATAVQAKVRRANRPPGDGLLGGLA